MRRRPVAAEIGPGRMLGEHYRVVRSLGPGRHGQRFEVERTTDRCRLAAKVLSEQSDRTALLRFAREAQILARLIIRTWWPSPTSTSPSSGCCSW